MEFGPVSCSTSSSYDLAIAMLTIVGGANAVLALVAGFEWKELARGSFAWRASSSQPRVSLIVVAAVAAVVYHFLGQLYDAAFFLPHSWAAGNLLPVSISMPNWAAALIVLAGIFFTLAIREPFRRSWPASSPYTSAAEAATRPLQLPTA
jgi:hypothetical protein